MKKTEKHDFPFEILIKFEVFITQPDIVIWGITLWLKIFIMGLLLKFLSIVEVLLTRSQQFSELRD